MLPYEFLQNEEISVNSIINNFSKTLDVPASSLPRHNSSIQLPSELPAELLSAPLVRVCPGGIVPPLQLFKDGPYTVLRRRPCSFTIWVGSRDEFIAVSCLKALHGCGCRAWQPASLLQTAEFAPRRSCCNQVGLIFTAGLFTFLFGAASRRSWNHFPTRRGGFCMPGIDGAITGSTEAVPVLSTVTATEVRPLTSSPSSWGQSSGGALWRPAYTPGWRSNQLGVL